MINRCVYANLRFWNFNNSVHLAYLLSFLFVTVVIFANMWIQGMCESVCVYVCMYVCMYACCYMSATPVIHSFDIIKLNIFIEITVTEICGVYVL